MSREQIYKIAAWVLMVVAALVLIYSIWAFFHMFGFMRELHQRGALEDAPVVEIISVFARDSGIFLIYSLLLFAGGMILRGMIPAGDYNEADDRAQDKEPELEPEDARQLEEWFGEMKKDENAEEQPENQPEE